MERVEFWHEHSGSVLEAGQSAVVTIDRNQCLYCMLSHVPALYSALPQQRLLAHHHRHCHHCHHCHGYHEECSVPSMASPTQAKESEHCRAVGWPRTVSGAADAGAATWKGSWMDCLWKVECWACKAAERVHLGKLVLPPEAAVILAAS